MHPPDKNPLTDRSEILQLITLARPLNLPKMVTIGWLGAAPHIAGLENITIFWKISKYRKYHDILIYIGWFDFYDIYDIFHSITLFINFLSLLLFGYIMLCYIAVLL
jgi:hypothetical protein